VRLQAREGIINKRTVVLVSPGKKEKKARLSQKKKSKKSWRHGSSYRASAF
jgi:hypothetical protein